ncbi:MAG: phage portal protein, partial [Methylovulum sp.]
MSRLLMDNAQHTAFNFYAPEDERIDALAALQKTYQPTSTELLSAEVLAEITALAHNKAPLLKAIDPAVVPFPSANSAQHAAGMQSVYLDEFQLNSQGDYWERPSSLSFDSLRAMAAQTPILNAVIMTRVRQVQRFARLCDTNNTLPGFEIRHIDRKHQLTTDQHEKIIQLQNFISHGGNESSPRARRVLRRDSFAQFMGKATRDSLLLDSVAIETERAKDRSLGLTGLYVVDGATIRLCPESGYRNNKDLFAVQVVNGLVRTAYGYDDLLYEARNPRSDVTTIGYGLPETELLVRVVTGFLNAMTLNNNVFDKNAIPKGILHLSGNYSQEDLSAFKRYWHGMVKGLDSHLTVPVLVSKDQESRAAFEKFGVDFNEMMFAKWMTFLTSIICAIYGMSPSEINFDSFTGGSTSALGGNDTAEKLAASKDSGLRPLLAYFENLLTDYVVGDLESNFCFRWTGLDVEDQDKKYELRKTLLTLNELRAEEGYEKIEGALGEAPVDASLLNAWMQLQAQQQPEDEGETNDGENKQQDDGNDKELSKSFKHHEGRQGQRGGSLSKQTVEIGSGQSVPPSSTIATYQQAHDYYQANLAGKSFLIDVKTKSNLQPIAVFFDRLNSHIYTREAKEGETPDTWDNKKHYRGSRVFDASRAVHMDKILPTLQHPTIILDSNGRDLYIGKKIDMDRFEIVVLTVDSVNKCTLSTAQPRSKEEVKRLRERLRSVKPGQLRKAFEGLAEAQELHLASRTDLLALRASTLGLSNNPPVPTLQVQTEATETIIPYPHFVKSEPLHDEHGRFSASDSNSEIGSIDTLQAAEHYYQDHLAGVWRLTIQRKAGNFDVNVNFNENQDHAYTKTNKETGLREFDLVRAKFMPQMLGTITEPEVILQNGNRDLFIEKQLDNIHYAVVLEWKDSAKEYRFRSAHCWNKAEYDNHLKKYNRPASHGKKTTQKKAPERLSKSSGAYSTFTHLRDSTALLQSPPKHNCKSGASLVNPIGLGGEL